MAASVNVGAGFGGRGGRGFSTTRSTLSAFSGFAALGASEIGRMAGFVSASSLPSACPLPSLSRRFLAPAIV